MQSRPCCPLSKQAGPCCGLPTLVLQLMGAEGGKAAGGGIPASEARALPGAEDPGDDLLVAITPIPLTPWDPGPRVAPGPSTDTSSGLNLRLHIAMMIAVLFLER